MSRIALVALLLVACGDECGSDAERSAPATEAHPAPPSRTQPARPPMRLVRSEGEVRIEGLPATPRMGLNPGSEIAVTGTAVADCRGGPRFELMAGARARVGQFAPCQLLLSSGSVVASIAATGNSDRPGLRLGTASGTVILNGAGEVWVLALPSGDAWFGVLAGAVNVVTGAADEEGNPRRVPLRAGQAVLASEGGLAAVGNGPTSRDEAESQALQRVLGDRGPGTQDGCGDREPPGPCPPRRDAARRGRAREALGRALSAYEAELAQGRQLQDRHRRAVRQQSPVAGDLQRRLVGHSLDRLRLRAMALARWERLSAMDEVPRAPDGRTQDQVARLLGLDYPPSVP